MYDIWVDIANSPRVIFFKSLLNDLKKYSIYISTSPIGGTTKLMNKFGMKGRAVGGIEGVNSKTITAIVMIIKLAYKIPKFNFALTLEGVRPIVTAKIRNKHLC